MKKRPIDTALQWLAYFRNTLADGERVEIEPDAKYTLELNESAIDMQRGVIAEAAALRLIQAEEQYQRKKAPQAVASKTIEQVEIFLAPFSIRLRPEHTRTSGEPTIQYPFWIKATLDRQGQLTPSQDYFPYVPRVFLSPQTSQQQRYVLSDVDQVDRVLASSKPQWTKWSSYWIYVEQIFQKLTGHSLATYAPDGRYQLTRSFTLTISHTHQEGASAHIIRLYDSLRQKATIPALLRNLLQEQRKETFALIKNKDYPVYGANHVGQMHNQYPLSPSQRQSLYHWMQQETGDVLAVNGPPGTGKTTLLQSIVAQSVVESARRGKPAIVLACSFTNQAVTNIMDSFSEVATGQSILARRWLPPVTDQGDALGHALYLRSKSPKKDISGKASRSARDIFYTEGWGEGIPATVETREYVNQARTTFRQQYAAYTKDNQLLPVGVITDRLQQRISQWEQTQQEGIRYWQHFTRWAKHYAGPAYVSHFRRASSQNIQIDITELLTPRSVRTYLLCFLIPVVYFLYRRWHGWQQRVFPTPGPVTEATIPDSEEQLQEYFLNDLEVSIKHRMFLLATHYWEGRWIMTMQQALKEGTLAKRGEKHVIAHWQRRAMLTPCLVSTFHMAPRFFSYSKHVGKNNQQANLWDYPPLLEVADTLIVDEAGQVSPEVGAATFALAKRAIVVGDVHQIEPVWNVPGKVDEANLVRAGLLSHEDDPYREHLHDHGFLGSSGSLMKLAQKSSGYQLPHYHERGMLLTEHRRCYDEIITYCNELVYCGLLQPLRGSSPQRLFPAMGLVPVEGTSQTQARSRFNAIEAEAIAQWLLAHQEAIETTYDQPLENLVGIITPFRSQKQSIERALWTAGIPASRMKIGTVHALQGAQRRIVLFSAVYGSGDLNQRYFFDCGDNLLNVAVSRAQDHFIVFGHPAIFSQSGNTPSGKLAQHLQPMPVMVS